MKYYIRLREERSRNTLLRTNPYTDYTSARVAAALYVHIIGKRGYYSLEDVLQTTQEAKIYRYEVDEFRKYFHTGNRDQFENIIERAVYEEYLLFWMQENKYTGYYSFRGCNGPVYFTKGVSDSLKVKIKKKGKQWCVHYPQALSLNRYAIFSEYRLALKYALRFWG